MKMMRSIVLSYCLIALGVVGCSSKSSEAEQASEPAVTAGAETTEPTAPASEATPTTEAPTSAAPEATASTAPAAEPQMPPLGSVVTHKVKDYAAWKPVFDAHEAGRKEAGIAAHCVMKDVKNPNTISVWAAHADQAKVDALLGSDDLKAKMKESGVVGKPAVVSLKHVSMSPPMEKQPKFGALVSHSVKDFDAWKTAFESHDQARKDAGIVGWAVSQDPKEPTKVVVWLEAEEQAKLEEFLKSKDLKAKMKEAGVKGAPKSTVYEILEFKMYN